MDASAHSHISKQKLLHCEAIHLRESVVLLWISGTGIYTIGRLFPAHTQGSATINAWPITIGALLLQTGP
eukprot:1159900-Pelagomonas_calceolata.AAC.4